MANLVALFFILSAIIFVSLRVLQTTLFHVAPLVFLIANLASAYCAFTSVSARLDSPSGFKADEENSISLGPILFELVTVYPFHGHLACANIAPPGNHEECWRLDRPCLWYKLGIFFCCSRIFWFSRKAIRLLGQMVSKKEMEAKGRDISLTDVMWEWLEMHLMRTLETDVPVVLCYLTATYLGLRSV